MVESQNRPKDSCKDKERYWDSDRNIMLVHCEKARESLAKLLEREGLKKEIIIDKTIHRKWCPICKCLKNIEENNGTN